MAMARASAPAGNAGGVRWAIALIRLWQRVFSNDLDHWLGIVSRKNRRRSRECGGNQAHNPAATATLTLWADEFLTTFPLSVLQSRAGFFSRSLAWKM